MAAPRGNAAVAPRRTMAAPRENAAAAPRRTVTIRGQVADRHSGRLAQGNRRHRPRSVQERATIRPDRVAMWAVLLGVLLVLAAATSSHAAGKTLRAGKQQSSAHAVVATSALRAAR
jgi:hypothetical protein